LAKDESVDYRVPTFPGKSWNFQEKKFFEITFFIGSSGKQAEIVYHPVYVDWCSVAYLNTAYNSSKNFSACFAPLNTCFCIIFKHSWAAKKVLEHFSRASCKVLDKSWIFYQ